MRSRCYRAGMLVRSVSLRCPTRPSPWWDMTRKSVDRACARHVPVPLQNVAGLLTLRVYGVVHARWYSLIAPPSTFAARNPPPRAALEHPRPDPAAHARNLARRYRHRLPSWPASLSTIPAPAGRPGRCQPSTADSPPLRWHGGSSWFLWGFESFRGQSGVILAPESLRTIGCPRQQAAFPHVREHTARPSAVEQRRRCST